MNNKTPHHQFITHNGASIHFNVQGEGKNVILLHGYLESMQIFDDFALKMSQVARVVTIDLPGHGLSDLIKSSPSLDSMAEAIKNVADHLNMTQLYLMGHSMGGYVTLAFAEKYPQMLQGLALLHSTPNPDTPEKQKNRQREMDLIRKGKKEIICKSSIPNTFANTNRELFAQKIQQITNTACKTPDEGIIAALESMMNRPDQNEMLSKLEAKKISLIGKQDNFIPWESALETCNKTNMHPILLESSGHMGFIEEPNECLQQIIAEMELG